MRSIKPLIYSVLLGYGFFGCNPNCDNITGVYFSEQPYVEKGEILIKSSNTNNLRNRNVFFDEKLAEKTTFIPDVGLIAKMPEGVTGDDVSLRIQDQDCGDFVSFSLNVKSASFFTGNPNYIPPAPPQIIIPTPNPPIPPNINNAWVSPDNTDYCIWFVVVEVGTNTGNYTISPVVNASGKKSQELSVARAVCGDASLPETGLYHTNPVYGMINTKDNIIQFWIDRTGNSIDKNLGIEEFYGEFIDVGETPYKNDEEVPECNSANWGKNKLHMMMVTSKQTNRTLILYQQL